MNDPVHNSERRSDSQVPGQGPPNRGLRSSLNRSYRFRSAIEIAKTGYQNKRAKPLLEPL